MRFKPKLIFFRPDNVVNISDIHKNIAKELLNKIQNESNNVNITYGELSKRLGGYPYHRNLDGFLYDLSTICKDNNMPLISTIVVNKKTNIAGDGFFNAFYEHLKTDQEKKDQYIKCLQETKDYKYWDKLKRILNII